MRPRFQADADFNHRVVAGLRRREPAIDILGAHEGGVVGLTDPEVLRVAAETGRILVSHDRKTMPGHHAEFIRERRSAGVLLVSQAEEIGVVIDELLLVWAASTADEWVDRIGYLPF